MRQAFFNLPDGGFIELVAPLTEDSPVAKAIESRGEGVHVVSMSVDDAGKTLESFKDKGVALAGNFVHPKAANGVMFGLTED